jgi:hypothetical protein
MAKANIREEELNKADQYFISQLIKSRKSKN